MKRLRKWLIILFLAVLGLGLAPRLAEPMLRERIEEMVAQQLNATLKMDSLSYRFPYAIRLYGASIVARGTDGTPVELFHVDQLDLSLAKLPFGQGPLVIRKLAFKNPSLHLIETSDGTLGHAVLRNPPKSARADDIMKAIQQGRLSEIFQLRRFVIESGQIIYVDRRRADQLPMVWRNLNVDLTTTPQSGVLYDFKLAAQSPPMTTFKVAGMLDVDQLMLDVQHLNLDLEVDPRATQSQLPGALQDILRENQIAGAMHLSGTAQVPLRDPGRTQYSMAIDLPRASATVPKWDATVDHLVMKVRCSNVPSAQSPAAPPASEPTTTPTDVPPIYVYLDQFEAGSGDTLLRIDPGASVQFDSAAARWSAHDLAGALDIGAQRSALPTGVENLFNRLNLQGHFDLTARASGPTRWAPDVRPVDQIDYEAYAYPRRLSFQPGGFPQAIKLSKLGGAFIHLLPGSIVVGNFEANYGDDRVIISHAKIPLSDLPVIHINGLDAAILFSDHFPDYPDEVNDIMQALHPGGTWRLTGQCTIDPDAHPKLDYSLYVSSGQPPTLPEATQSVDTTSPTAAALAATTTSTAPADSASLAPTKKRFLLTNIRMSALLSPSLIDVTRFQADSYGGLVEATGKIVPGVVDTYSGKGEVAGVNLAELAKAYSNAGGGAEPIKLSGKGNVTFLASGTEATAGRTLADNFRATGEFEVLDGDFWELPIIRHVLDRVRVARNALTVGQAAAQYNIHDKTILIEEAAIGSPAIGLQGSGEVHFDGAVDASVVVAPLADWKAKLEETGVPIVSRAVGEVAGRLQNWLNNTTSKLIYKFHVTGTVHDPEVNAVAAPVVTESLADLFGHMMKTEAGERLIETIHRIHPRSPATTEPEESP